MIGGEIGPKTTSDEHVNFIMDYRKVFGITSSIIFICKSLVNVLCAVIKVLEG